MFVCASVRIVSVIYRNSRCQKSPHRFYMPVRRVFKIYALMWHTAPGERPPADSFQTNLTVSHSVQEEEVGRAV